MATDKFKSQTQINYLGLVSTFLDNIRHIATIRFPGQNTRRVTGLCSYPNLAALLGAVSRAVSQKDTKIIITHRSRDRSSAS